MDPPGKVTGAVADDRVLRQVVAQPAHHLAVLEASRQFARIVGPGEIIRMRGGRLLRVAARTGVERCKLCRKRDRARLSI